MSELTAIPAGDGMVVVKVGPVRMECLECGKFFTKLITSKTTSVKCPRCGGYDTDID